MIRYKRAPTRDPDESGQSDGEGVRSPTATIVSGSVEQNGHENKEQRKVYLIVFSICCLSALAGLTLLVVWIFQYRSGLGLSSDKVSNVHALTMFTFMVSMNMFTVLLYRTFYDQPKERLKLAHATLSGVNIVMALFGVTIMFRDHFINNKPNLYSLHSWIGLTTNTLYVSQFIFSFLAFMNPGFSKPIRAMIMPHHRFLGAMVLVMVGLSAVTGMLEWAIWGIGSKYQQFVPATFIANSAGMCVILMTASSIWLLSQSRYRRVPLPEEQELRATSK